MQSKKGSVFAIGATLGAVAIMILSLSMGWVVTSGLAKTSAKDMSQSAVIDSLVPICMHQFKAHESAANSLVALKKMETWEREGYVSDKGWATMPGSSTPARGVARECASRLIAMG